MVITAVTVAKGDKLFSIQPDLTQCRRICYACERLPANRSVPAEVLVDLCCDLRDRNPGTRLAHRSSLQAVAVGSANGVHPGWTWHSQDDAAPHPKDHAQLTSKFGTELDLPLRRSFRLLRSTAALLVGAGFLAVWLLPNVCSFRLVLARGWHDQLVPRTDQIDNQRDCLGKPPAVPILLFGSFCAFPVMLARQEFRELPTIFTRVGSHSCMPSHMLRLRRQLARSPVGRVLSSVAAGHPKDAKRS